MYIFYPIVFQTCANIVSIVKLPLYLKYNVSYDVVKDVWGFTLGVQMNYEEKNDKYLNYFTLK